MNISNTLSPRTICAERAGGRGSAVKKSSLVSGGLLLFCIMCHNIVLASMSRKRVARELTKVPLRLSTKLDRPLFSLSSCCELSLLHIRKTPQACVRRVVLALMSQPYNCYRNSSGVPHFSSTALPKKR